MPIEVKSRVSSNSSNEAFNQLRQCLGPEDWNGPEGKYFFELDATDPKFFKIIDSSSNPSRAKNEAFQILHHCFVYSVDKALLLIGSDEDFFCCIKLKFSAQLLSAYETLLDMFYEQWFEKFYTKDFVDFPLDEINEALMLRNKKRKKRDHVSLHSFVTNYKLWRCLNIDVTAGIKFPLPPIAMIVPFVNSFWNSTKGPSDTMTKLLDSCEENLGIRSPQSVAIARLIGLMAIAFHRDIQVATSKNHDFYQSIFSFRSAANSRLPFQKSLSTLIHLLREEKKEMDRNTRAGAPSCPTIPPTPPRHIGTRRNAPVQRMVWNRTVKTGNTPKKGRVKKGSIKQLKDEERCATCIGIVPALTENRLRCRLCGMPTNYICTWCKRPLCLTAGLDLDQKHDNYIKKFKIPIGKHPSKHVMLTEFDSVKNERIEMKAVNTCYHLAHSKQWEEFFARVNAGDDEQKLVHYHEQIREKYIDDNKEN